MNSCMLFTTVDSRFIGVKNNINVKCLKIHTLIRLIKCFHPTLDDGVGTTMGPRRRPSSTLSSFNWKQNKQPTSTRITLHAPRRRPCICV